tara:strand:- start:5274 stop:5843 length:570 start_codon:yes stop_codon:yes gene_type:complete
MSADAVLVLGGGVTRAGALSPISKLRVEEAVRLYKNDKARRILMSGKHNHMVEIPSNITEAQAMKAYAMLLGVHNEHVYVEEQALDTVGSAYFSRLLVLNKKRWKRIIVVSSEYHLDVTMYMFKKILGPKYSLEFIGINSELSQEEMGTRAKEESVYLENVRSKLDLIEDGDDEAVARWIYTELPWYKN